MTTCSKCHKEMNVTPSPQYKGLRTCFDCKLKRKRAYNRVLSLERIKRINEMCYEQQR